MRDLRPKLIVRLMKTGVDASLPPHEAKHVSLTNRMAFLLTIWHVFLAVLLGDAMGPDRFHLALALGVAPLAAFLLNYRRMHLAASLWVFVSLGAFSVYFVMANPEAPDAIFYCVVLGVVPSLLFSRSNMALRLGGTLLASAVFGWLLLSNQRLPVVTHPEPGDLDVYALLFRQFSFVMPTVLCFLLAINSDRSEKELDVERAKSEALLLNILPRRIADRLKAQGQAIAERFDEATVLFADIVGFTGIAEKMSPTDLVAMLDNVFTRFDAIADATGVEKIKTIGDAYMMAAGVPEPRPDHADAIADAALAMQRVFEEGGDPKLKLLSMRIGVHTGSLVAGVIGKRKFVYDLWGDTANTASRMESHGEAGKIMVTHAVYEKLKGKFSFEPRGTVKVKGKGEMQTYFLLGRIQAREEQPQAPRALP
ncbi:MAG: adenylate/guanylate cyclase domain-containing protein [Polyangiaceae bacterium]